MLLATGCPYWLCPALVRVMMTTMVGAVVGMARVGMVLLKTHMVVVAMVLRPAGMAVPPGAQGRTLMLAKGSLFMAPAGGWPTGHLTLARRTTTITTPMSHSGSGQQSGLGALCKLLMDTSNSSWWCAAAAGKLIGTEQHEQLAAGGVRSTCQDVPQLAQVLSVCLAA
jgi:hypothetical protein